jgi:hypothetical protein
MERGSGGEVLDKTSHESPDPGSEALTVADRFYSFV